MVLAVGGVADPVDGLDGPLPPGEAGRSLGGAPAGVQAGVGVDDLFGDGGSVDVEDVTADADDLGGVREADAVGGDGPQRADDTAVAAAGVRVVRGGGVALCLDFGSSSTRPQSSTPQLFDATDLQIGDFLTGSPRSARWGYRTARSRRSIAMRQSQSPQGQPQH